MRAQTEDSRADLQLRLGSLEAEVERLQARHSATAQILRAIATAPTEAVRALEIIAESAAALCDAYDAIVYLKRGACLVTGAHHGPIPIDFGSFPIARGWTAGRSVVDRKAVHIHDLRAETDEFPEGAQMARRLGHRTTLSVPIVARGEAMGAITLRRLEIEPFGEDDVALLETFADQAVIAIENTRLFTEVQARNREVGEALERQTATGDVLRTISSSPTDAQPVFDGIAASAARLCNAEFCHVFRFDTGMVHFVAHNYDESSPARSQAAEGARSVFAEAPDTRTAAGRVFLTGSVVHIPDIREDDGYALGATAELLGYRSIVAVPMLRDGVVIGSINVMRCGAGPFPERQVELLKTFAAQAVIAIENARLFGELREALHQQTATADVLKAISRSTFDLPTVLSTLVEAAVRLCDADQGTIARERDGVFVRVASHGFSPKFMAAVLDRPIGVDRHSASGRALVEGRTIHIPDVTLDPDYEFPEALEHGGFRSIVGVPMLRDGAPIGVLALSRRQARPFTDKQMELLASFADQAAIAIENVRLFEALQARTGEVQESLEQQTATSEILRAISTSMTDAQPVFDTIVRNAVFLCDSLFANVFRFDGEHLHFVASHNVGPGYVELLREKYPMRPDPSQVSGRVIISIAVVRLEDALADPNYDQKFPSAMAWRRMLGVPMLRDGVPIGAIVVGWAEAGPIPERQEELLKTFADQAVIAIENARLFRTVQARTRELEEALEQQTASGDILRAISSSPGDVRPVFETIVERAARLCDAEFSAVARFDGSMLHLAAVNNMLPSEKAAYHTIYPRPPTNGYVMGRALLNGRPVQVEDVSSDPDYDKATLDILRAAAPYRSYLGVPILLKGAPIGAIGLGRRSVRPFIDREISLVQTFADQAVIAIENARLFTELEVRNRELSDALAYQTAITQILQVIGRSPSDAQPVFDAIVDAGRQLFPNAAISITLREGDFVVAAAIAESEPDLATAFRGLFPIPLEPHYMHSRAILDGIIIDIPDASLPPKDLAFGARNFLRTGYHAVTIVPMFRRDLAIGAISVVRVSPGPLSSKERDLLSTFANQAVIAIENARLFQALQSAVAEFNAVLDHVDYGVLFMDSELRARIVNPALRRLWDLPQDVLDRRPTIQELFEYNRHRGVYTTPPEEWDEWVARRIERIRAGDIPPGEFVRADRKVYSYQCVALPDGGRMLSYFDITELKNRQAELLKAKEAAEAALAELRTAQERLVQSEKLASLGQLTAGIAHEIKNPLNFVNNFAALSRDLLAELEAVLQAPISALEAAAQDDAEDLFRTVRENLDKIAHHGKRADSIVKNMLLHARQGSGEWREADINAIAEEALNLAYHGARAGHPDFNVEIVKHLDPEAGTVECCPQDIMRVVLNLVSNGIYAANKKRATVPAGFGPRIDLTTRAEEVGVAVEVRDNGTGIPAEIRDRIFLPFFTTKPAGEGTGLGLSLSHDIVVKQHGGSFAVESEPGAFTLFRVLLPRHAAAGERVES